MKKISDSEQAFRLLVQAAKRNHPVTISYTRQDGTETVRTIEVYQITRNKQGDRYAKAMVRTEDPAGELRSFRLDRITALTVHRTAYKLTVPEPKSVQRPVQRTAAEILREMHDTGRNAEHAPAVAA